MSNNDGSDSLNSRLVSPDRQQSSDATKCQTNERGCCEKFTSWVGSVSLAVRSSLDDCYKDASVVINAQRSQNTRAGAKKSTERPRSQDDGDDDMDDDETLEEEQRIGKLRLSEKLNSDMNQYQQAMKEYAALEESTLAQISPEEAELVQDIKRAPEGYLNSENVHLRNLAIKRAELARQESNMKMVSASSLNRDSRVSVGGKNAKDNVRASLAREGSITFWKRGMNLLRLDMGHGQRKSLDASPKEAAGASGSAQQGSLSKILSSKWAERLIDVDPTRGKLREVDTGSGKSMYVVQPEWPAWLTDISFDIVKKNKYGKRQRRMLGMTEYCFFNVRNGTVITRSFPYSAIKNLWLKNQSTLVIYFDNNYVYECESEFAPVISQQLSTRARVRAALDREGDQADGLHDYSSATEAMASSISSGGVAREGTRSIVTFARTISERFPSQRDESRSSIDDTALAARLLSADPGSPEHAISTAVRNLLFDKNTPEGHTRITWINKFEIEETEEGGKTATTNLRHFIDGMHEFIIEKRGASMATMYLQFAAGAGGRSPVVRQTNIGGRRFSTEGGSSSHPVLDNSGAAWWTVHKEYTVIAVSLLTFLAVEQSMYMSLENVIPRCFPVSRNQADERNMVCRLRYLSNRTQSEWDIPVELQSPVFWENARNDLKGIEHSPNQSMKLYALVRCAKSIYSEFHDVVLKRIQAEHPGKEVTLGADDFLPIFMFVLCQSDLRTPMLNKELLWGLCHPDQLYGESGYYLTVYESALEYIQCIPLGDELLESFSDSDTGSFKVGSYLSEERSTGGSVISQLGDKLLRRSVARPKEGNKQGGSAHEHGPTSAATHPTNRDDDDDVLTDLSFIRSQPRSDDEGLGVDKPNLDGHGGLVNEPEEGDLSQV